MPPQFIHHEAAEVGGIARGLEADHVIGQHGADERACIGQRRQNLRRRERNVQEEADGNLYFHLAQRRGQRHEVIVMHPDEIILLQQWMQPGGKALVHMPVAVFKGPVEDSQIKPVMQHRPERPVCIAGVEIVMVGLIHVDLNQLDRLRLLLLKGAEGAFLGDLAAPAEPQSAGTRERIDQSHGEPSSLACVLHRAHPI